MSASAAFCLPTSDMVMRSPSSAVLLLAFDMFEVSSKDDLLVGNEIGSVCGTQVDGGKRVRQILTACSSVRNFGPRPRLSINAWLILPVVAEGIRHHSHMQVAVHSVNHCVVWTRPLCVCVAKIQIGYRKVSSLFVTLEK